eukprot:snap_masked-scaffold_34-processed-gene-2.21-mRNA-1 protein AED:1.00 eAED:1.00 QI:0/-1/0/0/-1/1/1/0/436
METHCPLHKLRTINLIYTSANNSRKIVEVIKLKDRVISKVDLETLNSLPPNKRETEVSKGNCRRGKKRPKTSYERFRQDLADLGDIPVEEIVKGGEFIFDSARRCLRGGKKRKVIQGNSPEERLAPGAGWRVNFKTIVKHIKEREKKLLLSESEKKAVANLTNAGLTQPNPVQQVPNAINSQIKTEPAETESQEVEIEREKISKFTETFMKRIWKCLSGTRVMPFSEREYRDLEETEASVFIHYALPKNEWFFGQQWHRKTRTNLLEALAHRITSRAQVPKVERTRMNSSSNNLHRKRSASSQQNSSQERPLSSQGPLTLNSLLGLSAGKYAGINVTDKKEEGDPTPLPNLLGDSKLQNNPLMSGALSNLVGVSPNNLSLVNQLLQAINSQRAPENTPMANTQLPQNVQTNPISLEAWIKKYSASPSFPHSNQNGL